MGSAVDAPGRLSRRRRPRIDALLIVVALLLVNGIGGIGGFPGGGDLGPNGSDQLAGIASGPPATASPGPSAGSSDGLIATTPPSGTPTGPATPPTARTVTVRSIPALLTALADDSVGEIVVANGTYHLQPSSELAADSLWIGGRFARRTRPVTVRAETTGGVTFDGTNGGTGFGGLSFEDGAHDQTWDGFTFANMAADRSGIIGIGGYTVRRAPYGITLRDIRILRSCTGSATSHSAPALDHAVYVANALDPGPHDIVFESISIDGRGGLASAFHFFHSDPGAPNASNLVVRDLTVTGTQQALIFWDRTLRNITFDDVTINGALNYAIRYETTGSSGIVVRRAVSRDSGFSGFYSTQGTSPDGIAIVESSLR